MSPRGRNPDRYRDDYDLDGDDVTTRFDEWEVDPELVWEAVRKVVRKGDGILFRATSDGGAIQVTIYRPGDDPRKKYLGTVGAFTSLLQRIRGNPLDNAL